MSDDHLPRSHLPSSLSDYEFKAQVRALDEPSYVHWSDARWYPGHPASPYPNRPSAENQYQSPKIETLDPVWTPNEGRGELDTKNVASVISYGLLACLIGYMFWML